MKSEIITINNHRSQRNRILFKYEKQRMKKAEKKKDQIDDYYKKIASLVPMVSMLKNKKNRLDILRLTIAHIRLHHEFLNCFPITNESKPKFLNSQLLENAILQDIGGFVIIFNDFGKIIYTSDGIEKILGFSIVDLLERSIYCLIHRDDYEAFKTEINNLTNGNNLTEIDENVESRIFCSMQVSDPNRNFNDPLDYEPMSIILRRLKNTQLTKPSLIDERQEKNLFFGIFKACGVRKEI